MPLTMLCSYPALIFRSWSNQHPPSRAGCWVLDHQLPLSSTALPLMQPQKLSGAGEAFRGTVLGAIDSIDHTGETKHHEIARKGKEEINVALARLWGTGSSVQAAPSGTPGAAEGYDVGQGQPPAYQSIGDTGAGFRPDNKTGAPSQAREKLALCREARRHSQMRSIHDPTGFYPRERNGSEMPMWCGFYPNNLGIGLRSTPIVKFGI
ncbi:hypothetical protein C8J57DRAFT_1228281 [Mycena rebaudengoi]|nr:hypothetical protein C8J57DRAFT_1228281 [Mycena rebaudengoi]